MFLKRLDLENWKIHEKRTFEFCNRVNVLHGRDKEGNSNRVGKTAVLEALSFNALGFVPGWKQRAQDIFPAFSGTMERVGNSFTGVLATEAYYVRADEEYVGELVATVQSDVDHDVHVVRSITRKESRKETTHSMKQTLGELKGKVAAKAIGNTLVPMPELFLGGADLFWQRSATERQKWMLDVAGSSISLDDVLEALKAEVGPLPDDFVELLSGGFNDETVLLMVLENAREAKNASIGKRKDHESTWTSLTNAVNEATETSRASVEVVKELKTNRDLLRQVEGEKRDFDKAQARISTLQNLIDGRKREEAEISGKLKSAWPEKEELTRLKGNLKELDPIIERRAKLKEAVARIRTQTETSDVHKQAARIKKFKKCLVDGLVCPRKWDEYDEVDEKVLKLGGLEGKALKEIAEIDERLRKERDPMSDKFYRIEKQLAEKERLEDNLKLRAESRIEHEKELRDLQQDINPNAGEGVDVLSEKVDTLQTEYDAARLAESRKVDRAGMSDDLKRLEDIEALWVQVHEALKVKVVPGQLELALNPILEAANELIDAVLKEKMEFRFLTEKEAPQVEPGFMRAERFIPSATCSASERALMGVAIQYGIAVRRKGFAPLILDNCERIEGTALTTLAEFLMTHAPVQSFISGVDLDSVFSPKHGWKNDAIFQHVEVA